MFELEDCIAFLTSQAAKRMSEELENRFKDYHISKAQFFVLYYVDMHEQLKQMDLANYMGLKAPTIARLIDRMEKENLVHRLHDKDDRRIRYVVLTKEGKKIIDALYPIAQKFKDDATKDIADEHVQIYQDVLQKMQQNLNIL